MQLCGYVCLLRSDELQPASGDPSFLAWGDAPFIPC